MKGWSILLIILHNYLHFTTSYDGNEFYFSEECSKHLLENPSIPGIISFAGWIGVSIFIFLSGYGLVKKYSDCSPNFMSYFKHHILKLWKLLIPMYFIFWCINYLLCGTNPFGSLVTIVEQLLFIINFIDPDAITPGVYWFFGLILQFYLLFWIFRKTQGKTFLWIACSGLVLNYLLLFLCNTDTVLFIRHNFLGWIPSFFGGAAFACFDMQWKKKLPAPLLSIVSLTLLGISMVTKAFSPLTDILAIAFIISLVKTMQFKSIEFIGIISSSIFVVHPIIRLVIYQNITHQNRYLFSLLYLVGVLTLSILHYCLINKPRILSHS